MKMICVKLSAYMVYIMVKGSLWLTFDIYVFTLDYTNVCILNDNVPRHL